jgi:flagellar hook-length control protein FliK
MTLASASALPTMTVVAPPPASAVRPASPTADDSGFARALERARQGRRDASGDDAPAKSNAPARDADGAKETTAAQGADTPGDGDTAVQAEERSQRDSDSDLATEDDAGRADATHANLKSPDDGSLPPWMTATLPPAPAEPLLDAGDCTLPADTVSDPLSKTAPARAGSATSADDLATASPPDGGLSAARRSGADDDLAASDAAAERHGDSRASFRDTLAAASPTAPQTGAPMALTASGPSADHSRMAEAGAPVAEHALRAPLHSPTFAPALGAQLTLLVKEGVTEARLHLNPAEMGPISVQIQVDGSQARVAMVAEMAATRQVLEQSMPALAGALRESGLTLTGGGVFEQSTRQGQPGGDERSPSGSGGGAGPGSTDAQGGGGEARLGVRLPALPRGVVDVYA